MSTDRKELYAEKLAQMIRFETVSSAAQEEKTREAFHAFRAYLMTAFPHLYASASVEDFDGSLLLRWSSPVSAQTGGKHPLPVLFMSHHDVVEAGGTWTHPPFAGEIADGKLWGRGTLDTKGSLFSILQAAEELAAAGCVPARDLYFASTCTEETTGHGADTITQALAGRGIRFYMVLDEGGMIVTDPVGGSGAAFAMIGVGEKGAADLKFVAHSNGGHASMPGKGTPLVRLGQFMAAAERANLFPSRMPEVVQEMFLRMAPHEHGLLKFVFSHVKGLKPLLCRVIPMISGQAGAMLKTTLAFTMSRGSDGTNVLPQEAWVVGNMRYTHHQGRKASIEAVRRLAQKYGVETEVMDPGFSSSVTDFRGEPFRLVEQAVNAVFHDVTPMPYIMTGASDCRFFDRVCEHCIRFVPFRISDRQLDSIHGLDENVDLDTLVPAVDFYRYVMQTFLKKAEENSHE